MERHLQLKTKEKAWQKIKCDSCWTDDNVSLDVFINPKTWYTAAITVTAVAIFWAMHALVDCFVLHVYMDTR